MDISNEELKQNELNDNVKTLDMVNYQIAELCRIKEELEKKVNALLEHGDEGTKTYICGKHKVTVKTGYIYSLDKEEYGMSGHLLPECFRPVSVRTSYDVDKSIIKDIEKYGSQQDLEILSRFITKKPSKLYIKISAAV